MIKHKNMVKYKLLVAGFLKRMEIQYNLQIPTDFIGIICTYKLPCDTWSKQYSTKTISIIDDVSVSFGSDQQYPDTIVYGNHVVDSGVYEWTLQMIEPPTDALIEVGVTEDNPDIFSQSLYQTDCRWRLHGLCFSCRKGIYWQGFSEILEFATFTPVYWNEIHDIIFVKLDLDCGALYLGNHEYDMQMVVSNLPKTKYRLAVCLSVSVNGEGMILNLL